MVETMSRSTSSIPAAIKFLFYSDSLQIGLYGSISEQTALRKLITEITYIRTCTEYILSKSGFD